MKQWITLWKLWITFVIYYRCFVFYSVQYVMNIYKRAIISMYFVLLCRVIFVLKTFCVCMYQRIKSCTTYRQMLAGIMPVTERSNSSMDTIALILIVIGALNWGLVGIFQFDLVAAIFGGMSGVVSRIIYTLVGLAGIWGITMLFRRRNRAGIMSEHDET